MKKCIVKEVPLADLTAVHKLIPEFGDNYITQHFAEKGVLEKNPHFAVAYIDNAPAGYMASYDRYADGSMYCWMAGTIPAYRQSGVLTALMDDLEAWAQKHHYTSIRVKTHNMWRGMLMSLVHMNFMFTEVVPADDIAMNGIYLKKDI